MWYDPTRTHRVEGALVRSQFPNGMLGRKEGVA